MKQCPMVGAAVLAALLAQAPGPLLAAPEGVPAHGSGQAPAAITPEGLDLLLAPIALYPDQFLAQMLMCAANPKRVGELDAWLKKDATWARASMSGPGEKP